MVVEGKMEKLVELEVKGERMWGVGKGHGRLIFEKAGRRMELA